MFTRAWPEHAGCELLADGAGKTTTQGLRHAPKQITPFRPSAHSPDGDSIEPRAKEVKKESLMERIKPIGVSDFRSKLEWDTAEKGERPVGVPAARGHGVMEVQTFEAACAAPNTLRVCPRAAGTSIDRSVHLVPVRRYSKGVSRHLR
jgi:hypothetical protein